MSKSVFGSIVTLLNTIVNNGEDADVHQSVLSADFKERPLQGLSSNSSNPTAETSTRGSKKSKRAKATAEAAAEAEAATASAANTQAVESTKSSSKKRKNSETTSEKPSKPLEDEIATEEPVVTKKTRGRKASVPSETTNSSEPTETSKPTEVEEEPKPKRKSSRTKKEVIPLISEDVTEGIDIQIDLPKPKKRRSSKAKKDNVEELPVYNIPGDESEQIDFGEDPFTPGTLFPSKQVAFEVIQEYAKQNNFTVVIQKSANVPSHNGRLVIGCQYRDGGNKYTCPCRVHLWGSDDLNGWHVVQKSLEHSDHPKKIAKSMYLRRVDELKMLGLSAKAIISELDNQVNVKQIYNRRVSGKKNKSENDQSESGKEDQEPQEGQEPTTAEEGLDVIPPVIASPAPKTKAPRKPRVSKKSTSLELSTLDSIIGPLADENNTELVLDSSSSMIPSNLDTLSTLSLLQAASGSNLLPSTISASLTNAASKSSSTSNGKKGRKTKKENVSPPSAEEIALNSNF